jgi:hypothetical protein
MHARRGLRTAFRPGGFGNQLATGQQKMPPSPVRGASWKARKRSNCRTFSEAAEGTRTLDLLHGKQTRSNCCAELFPAIPLNKGPTRDGVCLRFRLVSPGFCPRSVHRVGSSIGHRALGPFAALRELESAGATHRCSARATQLSSSSSDSVAPATLAYNAVTRSLSRDLTKKASRRGCPVCAIGGRRAAGL